VLLWRADFFFPGGLLCLHTRAAQSMARAEGGLARARQTELTCSLLERAKNSCRQWSKRSVCGGARAGWQRDEPMSVLGGDDGTANGAVCCHGRELRSVTHRWDTLRESTYTALGAGASASAVVSSPACPRAAQEGPRQPSARAGAPRGQGAPMG